MKNGNESSLQSDGGADTRTGSALQSLFGSELSNGMDESDVFHILGNDRRREIICTLAEQGEELSVSDLAREIADKEENVGSSKNLYKSVYVSLQQTHLPKLAKKDIVVYDRDSQVVRAGPTFPQVEGYLRETDGRLPMVGVVLPLALSALGLLVALASTLQVSVFQSVGPVVVGGIFLILMVVFLFSSDVP